MNWPDSLHSLAPWIADVLVILGVSIMTLGVYGAIRMPDVYTKLHGASKSVFLGVFSLIAASAFTGEREIILRGILIGLALLLTTPIAAHVIGRAAYLEKEGMRTPGAVDESGQLVADGLRDRRRQATALLWPERVSREEQEQRQPT
ncbi:MAG TPA: monovalent cation/H(+) antiporter subunit G [Thermomicrobiales bacterium]